MRTKWTKEEIKQSFGQNQLRVLQVFANSKKPYIDSDDLLRQLGIKSGKQGGSQMAGFSKIAESRNKEPLVFAVFSITKGSHRGTRWAIKPENLLLVKEVIKELEPYMD